MRRISDLITMTRDKYPCDDFFDRVGKTLRSSSEARAFYRAYDSALDCLDPDSWEVLSGKAVSHFQDHREGQLKQGFFNQLNEAFGYQYLVRRGFSGVSMVPEGKSKTPDLVYYSGSERRHCEVKTVCLSEDEIARRSCENQYVNRSMYGELSLGFLKKLKDDLSRASVQITSSQSAGLIFVFAQFDDFTQTYYDRYREQISECLADHLAPEVCVKVGLIGGRRIQKPLRT